jgi:hypothetical protein
LGDRRRSDDTGDVFADGVEVFEREGVRIGVADVWSAAEIFGPDFIGADRLDLGNNKLLAGHADGDHQDQRRCPDDHP